MYSEEKLKQRIRRNIITCIELAFVAICMVIAIYRGDAMFMAVAAICYSSSGYSLTSKNISDLEEVVEQLKERLDG